MRIRLPTLPNVAQGAGVLLVVLSLLVLLSACKSLPPTSLGGLAPQEYVAQLRAGDVLEEAV